MNKWHVIVGLLLAPAILNGFLVILHDIPYWYGVGGRYSWDLFGYLGVIAYFVITIPLIYIAFRKTYKGFILSE